ncbi:MAG TPA: glycosyltransferase family 2 protein [Candidatus Angelobacter sp.]|nr:glycosyltransferase family 2 protein [Candidatus Angelobacter sp.]
MDLIDLSFVLPCLNEERTVERCIMDCVAACGRLGIQYEIIVADNGSSDRSREIALASGARVISVSRLGYGSALQEGILAARGTYVLMGDSDLSYDFGEMPRFLDKLREGFDLVMGCRIGRGGGVIERGAMPFLHRWLGNPGLSWLGRVLFRNNIIDFHCGIRGFRRQAILELGLNTAGMEFASEMIVKASLAKLRITQVPVTLRPDGRGRRPHLRTWRDGWRHLRFMLLHAPRWLFMYPGLFMLLVATVCFGLLLRGPITVAGTRFDTNTLLVCAVGMMAGFQLLLLGLFSEVFTGVTGLLPSSRLATRILHIYPFEKGILLGGALVLAGAVCLVLALLKWKNTGFGDLTYSDTLRLTIPSVTGMSLGIQIMFGGFLLAVLGLGEGRFENSRPADTAAHLAKKRSEGTQAQVD